MSADWKAGDWVVFDLKIGQIKELRDNGMVSFSDGFCETSGQLTDRFRPLTLRNKAIAETFEIYYRRLREMDGEAGFNYPQISSYFASLAIDAIDNINYGDCGPIYDKALTFIRSAREYQPVIDGVPLFRRRIP